MIKIKMKCTQLFERNRQKYVDTQATACVTCSRRTMPKWCLEKANDENEGNSLSHKTCRF